MKIALIAAAISLAVSSPKVSPVVRPATEFSWQQTGGAAKSLKSLRGQPVVLIIAKSASAGDFNAQIKKLRPLYQRFAERKTIFIAALQDAGGQVKSDIPFSLAVNGAEVAGAYGATKGFALVVIGKDGNVDLQTTRITPAQFVLDVITNSYAAQVEGRK
jgi:peroxiredoxin